MTTAPPLVADGADVRIHRWRILAVCCFGIFLASVDTTILNVALPSIGRSLGAPFDGLQWTLDSYTLVLATFLLLAGSLGDRFGPKATFTVGLAIFTAGSLLCSLAPGIGWLVGFRAIQALGGSILNPVALAIITATFRDARDRARAVGVWGSVAGLSLAVGPIAGGSLTDAIGWRSIFWVNLPFGIAAIILVRFVVPGRPRAVRNVPAARRDLRPPRFDVPGQIAVVVTLACLVAAFIEAPRSGWSSWLVIGLFTGAALGAVAVVLVDTHVQDPVIDFRFFASPRFASAVGAAVLSFVVFGVVLFLVSFYLQSARGLPPPDAGLCFLPMALAMMVAAFFSGRLVSRSPHAVPFVVAAAAYAAGGILLTGLSRSTPLPVLFASLALFGAGFGILNTAITQAAVSGMPRSRAGSAAGLVSSSRQVGAALGVALVGLATASSSPAGFAVSSHPMWWLVAGAAVAIGALGVAAGSRWGEVGATRVAHLLDDH